MHMGLMRMHNFYINDLFLFIMQATLHNYADDNTLAYFSKCLPDLVSTLENGSGVALSWMENNELIPNPTISCCTQKISN